MDAEPPGGLAQALDATGQLAAAVRDEQWLDPTPCPDWTVRDLVRHIIGGNRMFAAILRGEHPGASGGGSPAGPGQPARFPGALAEQELAFSRRALAGVPQGRSPFWPPQPAPADAPLIDQLAACLGRTVTAGSGGPGGGS